jgi:hypothetical protein
VSKVHVPKHKLRTGPWVVLTGDGPLCMGGCGVRGVFSACVRRLLLNIKPLGWSFSYTSEFFFNPDSPDISDPDLDISGTPDLTWLD